MIVLVTVLLILLAQAPGPALERWVSVLDNVTGYGLALTIILLMVTGRLRGEKQHQEAMAQHKTLVDELVKQKDQYRKERDELLGALLQTLGYVERAQSVAERVINRAKSDGA